MTDREKAAFLAGIKFHSEFAEDYCVHELLAEASAALAFPDGPHNPVLAEVMHEVRAALVANDFERLNERRRRSGIEGTDTQS
jgi:hypothetical protein